MLVQFSYCKTLVYHWQTKQNTIENHFRSYKLCVFYYIIYNLAEHNFLFALSA